jgi:hypothetical protein
MKEEPSLWLKFSGEELDVRSVPIYELGDTLVAIQRIIHKTFLFENDRLKKRAQLTQDERQRLSLQISERRKSSDLYALVPFAFDPALQQYLLSLLKVGLGTLAKYALKSVLSDTSKQKSGTTSLRARDVEGSVLVGAIYAETVQITNHINNIGGIDSIELIPSPGLNIRPVKLTTDTQIYVREIANESYRADPDEIVGYVTRLHPNRLLAEIKLAPSRYVKVGLDEESFRFVRYETKPEQQLRFKGHPIVRLGKDLSTFQEFEAESVEIDEATSY